ncbi:MAG: arginine--tRNA ligase [Halofilum sp. (in: g-proteobacteria)]
MKDTVASLIQRALDALVEQGTLAAEALPEVRVERARDRGHGDFATNVALVMAKSARRNPRELAGEIVAALPDDPAVASTEIAGPGFINFFLASGARSNVVNRVLDAGEQYGRSNTGAGEAIHIEYVSANPTGPLHVGHGRGAAFGASVANLLEAVGYDVHREYYVNDGGRQMDILAVSIWLRYLERLGETVPFPANGYRGDYVRAIAASLYEAHGDSLLRPASEVTADLPRDEPDGGDKEGFIDALVRRARALLDADWDTVFEHGVAELVAEIRDDLAGFGVEYEAWFSERSLFDSNAVERALAQLDANGYLYEHEGAKWFRSSEFGDEKDRVVVRENGDKTYFGADIAYHWNKIDRGHGRVIDVLGADHHGYIARMQAALQALGVPRDCFEVLLVQFAALWRGGAKIPMSTRAGQFVTLRELREEVGTDAARFFYVLRRNDQHLDFDLDLAKAQTQDNPVYYIQYAHARIASVMRQLDARGFTWDRSNGRAHLDRLGTPHEANLIEALERYPELIEQAAANREPHRVCYYLLEEVANAFHTWYNAEAFLVDDADLRDARLALIQATGQVIRNGLALVGVSAPEEM